jgi:tetratricopeptide (TPR) repeat protein
LLLHFSGFYFRAFKMNRIAWLLAALLWIAANPTAARAADDFTDCFSVGTENYNESSFFDRGLQACSRLIAKRTGKQLSQTYAARGSWQHKKKNYDAALADYDRALSIDAENVEFYDYRADAWMAKGDLDRAIDNYEQSIRIDPTYAAAYFSRGRAYERKGEIDRARESYRAALVPPRNRKLKIQERIQEWAQVNAEKRLKEMDAQPSGK